MAKSVKKAKSVKINWTCKCGMKYSSYNNMSGDVVFYRNKWRWICKSCLE